MAMEQVKTINDDHARLTALLAKREEEWKELEPKLQKEREIAIAKAKDELAAHEKEIAPRVAQQEKERQENIAKQEAALKEYEGQQASKQGDWEKKNRNGGEWFPLLPTKLEATNGATLSTQPDLSIIASGKNGKGNYVVVAQTSLKGIKQIRLEALEDTRIPSKGPGRAPDGNFVLTQFDVTATAKTEGAKPVKVALHKALASFSQENFDIKKAIDGSPDNNTGWAVSPVPGITHWATFETKEPLGLDGGTILTFTLRQTYNQNDFMLSRFRISVATEAAGLGLSDELRAIVAVDAGMRTDGQKEYLTRFYKLTDPELKKKQKAVADAKKPLPIDPRLKELQESLTTVSKPVPLDPTLAQLRSDTKQSSDQVANARLTATQDLAWALINSPAFLFNR
jgi:hypothetical protein